MELPLTFNLANVGQRLHLKQHMIHKKVHLHPFNAAQRQNNCIYRGDYNCKNNAEKLME